MHQQPPRTLKRLLKQYGQELIDDPRRTEALLRDLCGQHTREIFVLVNAQKQRVPSELRAAPTWMPRQAVYTRLSRMLQTKLAMTEDAADWAVASWAAALDLDALPKGESWSWLPSPLRAPAPTPTRKSRGKKRQNTPSGVQLPKASASEVQHNTATRKARNRAARAEVGWSLPNFLATLPNFFWKLPITWANLLPWLALITATVFLLAVVYWTSSARDNPQLTTDSNQNGTPITQTDPANNQANGSAPLFQANGTPLPELAATKSEYLKAVIPLPTWASVNVVTLYVREQPTTDSDVLDFLPEGEPVEVLAFSADGEWSQIQRPRVGWVSNDFLLFKSQDATQTSIQLNVQPRRTQRYEVAVRAAPNASAEITTKLAPDEAVVVATTMGEPPTWVQIADPIIGWIAANDLAPVSP